MTEKNETNTTPIANEDNVHTFLIIPGENHSAPKDGNRKGGFNLLRNLRIGGFAFIPIIGEYENCEQFQMVFNITISDAMYIAQHYPQEFFIFGIKDTNGIHFDLYVYNNEEERYEIVERQESRLETKEAGDIFTTTANNKSICISYQHFNEACLKFNTIINEAKANSKMYNDHFDKFVRESMDNRYTDSSRYMKRCLIYRGLF
jgi:hypothetical protein